MAYSLLKQLPLLRNSGVNFTDLHSIMRGIFTDLNLITRGNVPRKFRKFCISKDQFIVILPSSSPAPRPHSPRRPSGACRGPVRGPRPLACGRRCAGTPDISTRAFCKPTKNKKLFHWPGLKISFVNK